MMSKRGDELLQYRVDSGFSFALFVSVLVKDISDDRRVKPTGVSACEKVT